MIIKLHANKHVTREYLLFAFLTASAFDLSNGFRRNLDMKTLFSRPMVSIRVSRFVFTLFSYPE